MESSQLNNNYSTLNIIQLVGSSLSLLAGVGVITLYILIKKLQVPEFKTILWLLVYDIEWSSLNVFLALTYFLTE
jgi:hypothetical protein